MSMIHEITSSVPPHKRSQRKGRGESSGRGKTCGRGTKGSKARVGTYIKPGYEGGQTPIFKRLPKRGFSNYKYERRFHIVNVADLNRFDDGTIVDSAALQAAGLISDDSQPVKILGEGELTRRLTVVAGKYSKTAFEIIAKAGGSAQNLKGEPFAFPKVKKKFIPRDKNAPKIEGKGEKGDKGEKGGKKKPAEGAAESPATETPTEPQAPQE